MNLLIRLEQCESTNSAILQFLNPQSDGVFAVYTGQQTKGRGQYGNNWQTGKEINLAYSVAVKCKDFNASALSFNFHTVVLSRLFIDKMTAKKVDIKWPNDLILRNKKIAGLLVEKIKHENTDYYIFGIGINLLQTDFGDLASAGSILSQTGLRFSVDEFAKAYHDFLTPSILYCNGPEDLIQFNKHLFRRNTISVFEIENKRQNGIIHSVDENGFLLVELENQGMKKFTYKELKLMY